jgi:type IV secretion system protein VirB10
MSEWAMNPERPGAGGAGPHGPGDGNVDDDHVNSISPLAGEAGIPDLTVRRRRALSTKGLLAVGLLMGGLVGVSAFSIDKFTARGKKIDDGSSMRVSDRPAAATTEPRKLDIPRPSAPTPDQALAPASPRIPALVPTAEEAVEPIGVHRTGQSAPSAGHSDVLLPEDAPVVLVSVRPGTNSLPGSSMRVRDDGDSAHRSAGGSADNDPADPAATGDPLATTTRSLQGYQRQLQGMLDTLNRRTAADAQTAAGQIDLPGSAAGLVPGIGDATNVGRPLNSALSTLTKATNTPVTASLLDNRSLTLPKGTAFTCALKTKVISATSGPVGCQVQRNVYGDDGRVLLIERGSHLDGDYRITSVKPGTVRIPVVWTRLRTPQGVVVDIDSPGTGPLGEGGIDGYVDNRWTERIGAALLLSLIDDSVQMAIQAQASSNGNNGQANTVVLPSTTANTNKLAEKVLESTINIPPLIYQNQGGIVGIVVAHDVDFSSVYALRPTELPSVRLSAPSASAPASAVASSTR